MEVDRRSSVSSKGSSTRQKGNRCKQCNCLRTVSNAIIHGMEKAFFVIGRGIGMYPWVTMLCGVILTVPFVFGLAFFFEQENAPEKLWVPLGSKSVQDKAFVDEHFPTSFRFQQMLATGNDMLTPDVLQAMLDIDIQIKALVTQPNGFTWDDLCARLGTQCWSNSLLELWSFDATVIRGLSKADILTAVNTITTSPVYGSEWNASQILGGMTTDPVTGDITAAEAAIMQWVLSPEGTIEDNYNKTLDDVYSWEDQFLAIAAEGDQNIEEIFYFSGKTFADEGGGAISSDVIFLAIGIMMVIVLVAIVLGRFTRIRHRIYVSFGGVVCIGLAIVCSFGLCSYAGLFYGPVHSVLPFLLLGIGVDDMFVICQALDMLESDKDDLPMAERMGHTLKDAGVSITVTSLTDILAFAVGASTILPALRSFCAYAAVGVFFLFLFQATFFVACLAYDDLRVTHERNACCCCIVHKDDVPNTCSETLLVQTVFDKFYAPLLVKLPTKIVVTVVTAALLGVSIWGVVELEQDFDITWFLPAGTYASKYVFAFEKYFPSSGANSDVYFSETVNYYEDYDQLESLYFDVRNDPYVTASSVDCWYYSYREWLRATKPPGLGPDDFPLNENDFYTFLGNYLTTDGARFFPDFDFLQMTPLRIEASRMSFKHIVYENAAEGIRAMDSVRASVASYGYAPDECFVYSAAYLDAETNKVIQGELFRNLGLAFLCVFLMTLVLLADIVGCLLVCLCVIMVIVDVGGFMHFWGLTIDTVTSINLIVAIGLSVDYSAHIAHTFLAIPGTRDFRVVKTMRLIGPPVLYGGFSTFLAFVTVAASDSYIFSTFFKVFFLVVLFGMFHGLVFLPVILSWIGPNSYDQLGDDTHEQDKQAYENGGFHKEEITIGGGDDLHMNGISRKESKTDLPPVYHTKDSEPQVHPKSHLPHREGSVNSGFGTYYGEGNLPTTDL